MKLHNCCCGGMPEVTYNINDQSDFVVMCTNCDNRTPKYDSLRMAVSVWNQVNYCALPLYEIETA